MAGDAKADGEGGDVVFLDDMRMLYYYRRTDTGTDLEPAYATCRAAARTTSDDIALDPGGHPARLRPVGEGRRYGHLRHGRGGRVRRR